MPERILVVLPNWVGDVVLATPTLAAIRRHFSKARITFLMRGYVADVVAGGGWNDDQLLWPAGIAGAWQVAATLRARRVDLALLLTNSFKAAAAIWAGGAARRVGYSRDGRGWLLTDRLSPQRREGEFVPVSMLPYYAEIARRVGCTVDVLAPQLVCTAQDEAAAAELRRRHGLSANSPYALIVPGAAFGAAKCWLPERFAEVCDQLAVQRDLRCVLAGAPGEMPLLRKIQEGCRARPLLFDRPGTTLGSLKPLVRDAALLICNDTGPRHYGSAFNVPTVTIFGPTDPVWTESEYAGEITLQARVECGPCQLPRCPLDHRCMRAISAEHVMQSVDELLAAARP